MFKQGSLSLPIEGTEVASQWNQLYDFLMGVSVFFFVAVMGAMLYFVFKYRYQAGKETKYIDHHLWLEMAWVGVPSVILLTLFVWGFSMYRTMTNAPADAMEVRVIGKQWLWNFQYEDGRMTTGDLYVPVGKPVRLLLTSEDVLHGFFIPNFRIKKDAVPGMYTSLWFQATVPGKHQVYCTEYCGTSHSQMLAEIIALPERQWEEWSAGVKLGSLPDASDAADSKKQQADLQVGQDKGSGLAQLGAKCSQEKGCFACHSSEKGVSKIGPSFAGLFGAEVLLENGEKKVVDENFIRSHIEYPHASPIAGYPHVMPTFRGLISEAEMNSIVAYIKSLRI